MKKIVIDVSDIQLDAMLSTPEKAKGIVLFAHGSGSNIDSPRNQYVSQVLNRDGFATLLPNLLSRQEAEEDEKTRKLRFEINLLTRRLIAVTLHLAKSDELCRLSIGYFGSSTGAAAALNASTKFTNVRALVSRGGRTDLVKDVEEVKAPTLLLVGGNDLPTFRANERVLTKLKRVQQKRLVVIPGAGHVFEEPGKIEEVATHASSWFERYLD
jgi:putative phosphoribosyl transferase